jgi:hypothetical protein
MEEMLKKVPEFFEMTGLTAKDFYCISVYEDGVKFQGKFSRRIILELRNVGIQCSISDSGFAEGKSGVFEVTLTE